MAKAVRSRRLRWAIGGSAAGLLAMVAAFLAWWWLAPGLPTLKARVAIRAHPRATLTWYTSGFYERPGAVLAFSPDGRLLATGGEDDLVKLWDAATGKLVRALPFRGKVEWVGFTADGRHLVAEGHGSIPVLWEWPESISAESPPPPPPSPSPSGEPPAAPRRPDESTAQAWAVADGAPVGGLLDPPGRRLDRVGGKVVLKAADPVPGAPLALWDEAIRRDAEGLWGSLDGQPTLSSLDGTRYATGGAGAVRLWLADGRADGVLDGKIYRSPALAFSRDGRFFAAGTWNGGLMVRDLESGREYVLSTPSHNRTPLAISPDSRLIASVGSRVSATPPGWYTRLPNFAQRRLRGLVLAGNGFDPIDTAALWDARTGALRAILPGHEAQITSIAFSADGRALATSDFDGYVRIWAVP